MAIFDLLLNSDESIKCEKLILNLVLANKIVSQIQLDQDALLQVYRNN